MNNLAVKFLNIDEENIMLLNKGLDNKTDAAIEINKRFNDYLFKISFCSYVNKSIIYRAKTINKNLTNIKNREELSLNSTYDDSKEMLLNNIPDKPIDYIKELCKPHSSTDFNHICTDKKVLDALNNLSDKQKDIIYKYFILNKSEAEIAKDINISRQAVNKTKNIALKKLKSSLKNY